MASGVPQGEPSCADSSNLIESLPFPNTSSEADRDRISQSFNRKSDLQRHYRIHTNERPYACDYKPCNKTFIQRSALTVHRRTHTGDKPHKCPFTGCGKCFSDVCFINWFAQLCHRLTLLQSSSLARHRRIHTNDKPYICRNQRCKKA